MAEDISEARIQADLDRLAIVPPDTIRKHSDEHAEDLFTDTREPTSADETVQELHETLVRRKATKYEAFDDYVLVRFRGSSVDEGRIAIRTGPDVYVVHAWLDSWD